MDKLSKQLHQALADLTGYVVEYMAAKRGPDRDGWDDDERKAVELAEAALKNTNCFRVGDRVFSPSEQKCGVIEVIDESRGAPYLVRWNWYCQLWYFHDDLVKIEVNDGQQ